MCFGFYEIDDEIDDLSDERCPLNEKAPEEDAGKADGRYFFRRAARRVFFWTMLLGTYAFGSVGIMAALALSAGLAGVFTLVAYAFWRKSQGAKAGDAK